MIFLPVVERELRVAARKRSTFWLRIVAALVALVIGVGFLVLSLVGVMFGPASLGRGLFAVLTWLCLAAALSAGLFFTSDCLSEEKREGTIGFLFLTDLRGYDVVLGKLLATSLRCFYALLAVLPILAITLLMGGVAGAEFWKTSLALVNAMLLSLAAGLFVSAISRDSQKTLAGTLLLLVLLAGGGPAADGTIAALHEKSFDPVFSLSSPVYVFVAANGGRRFWLGLLGNLAIGWGLFGLASALLPRSWQDKAAQPSTRGGAWSRWRRFGGSKRRARLRRRLMDVNPVLWLACRERWQAASLWSVSLLIPIGYGLLAAYGAWTGDDDSSWGQAWGYVAAACGLLWYLSMASQSGRVFVEAKRSGLTELLLATPLKQEEIVQGQWRGLLRMFCLPLAIFLLAQWFGTFANEERAWGRRTAAGAPPVTLSATSTVAVTMTSGMASNPSMKTGATTNTVSVNNFSGTAVASPHATPSPAILGIVMAGAGTLTFAANLAALIWFGMWMGLTSRSANLAALKTIAFVQIIPWFAISFLSAMSFALLLIPGWTMKPGGRGGWAAQISNWFPLIFSGLTMLLSLAKDIFFCLWARKRLYTQFRERAIQAVAPLRLVAPPPLPPVG